jgi:hypothetical protein
LTHAEKRAHFAKSRQTALVGYFLRVAFFALLFAGFTSDFGGGGVETIFFTTSSKVCG